MWTHKHTGLVGLQWQHKECFSRGLKEAVIVISGLHRHLSVSCHPPQ